MPKRRDEQAPYWQQLRVAERGIIEYALEHGQTVRGTARLLGISPNYLGERMRELGIAIPEVRPGPKPTTAKRPARPRLQVVTDTPTLDEDPDEGALDEDEDVDAPEDVGDDADSDVLEDDLEDAPDGDADGDDDEWGDEDGEDGEGDHDEDDEDFEGAHPQGN